MSFPVWSGIRFAGLLSEGEIYLQGSGTCSYKSVPVEDDTAVSHFSYLP